MRIGMVVEAGKGFGLGHYMRSRILASEFVARGWSVDLHLRGDLEVMAFRPYPPCTLRHTLATTAMDDLVHEVVHDQQSRSWDWMIVDGYQVAATQLIPAGAAHCPIVQFDDLAEGEAAATLVINSSAAASTEVGRLLGGSQYALVDPAYVAVGAARIVKPGLERALIAFGGADRADWTSRVVTQLRQAAPNLALDVVIGPLNTSGMVSAEAERLTVHRSPDGLQQLMAQADLLIGAAGSTVWEACAAGLPMILLQTVDNQAHMLARAVESGAAYGHAERALTHLPADLKAMADRVVRQTMSQRGRQLVDGQASQRIADRMQDTYSGSIS